MNHFNLTSRSSSPFWPTECLRNHPARSRVLNGHPATIRQRRPPFAVSHDAQAITVTAQRCDTYRTLEASTLSLVYGANSGGAIPPATTPGMYRQEMHGIPDSSRNCSAMNAACVHTSRRESSANCYGDSDEKRLLVFHQAKIGNTQAWRIRHENEDRFPTRMRIREGREHRYSNAWHAAPIIVAVSRAAATNAGPS